jgi:hypothetical protein
VSVECPGACRCDCMQPCVLLRASHAGLCDSYWKRRDACGTSRTVPQAPCPGSPQTPRTSLPSRQDIPVLWRMVHGDAALGTYAATEGFLSLMAVLVSVDAPPPTLAPFVRFTLQHVLEGHAKWRYAHPATRWRIASTALRVLRHALLAPAPAPAAEAAPGAEAGLAASVQSLLGYEVGMVTCVLSALPPHASQLEVSLCCWVTSPCQALSHRPPLYYQRSIWQHEINATPPSPAPPRPAPPRPTPVHSSSPPHHPWASHGNVCGCLCTCVPVSLLRAAGR